MIHGPTGKMDLTWWFLQSHCSFLGHKLQASTWLKASFKVKAANKSFFFLHSWKDELPGGRMTRVWRLMIKCIGTIMNYLWDASTSVECTRMTKRQAISFSRSLIRSILLQVTAPCFISKLVFQCFPVPISETGRILWDLFYKKGA